MQYNIIIGLEVHIGLKTKTKCFCDCQNDYNASINQNICPVCKGLPGTVPSINKEAVIKTISAGLLLNGNINNKTIFERKHLFFPSLSKGYQTTQYKCPIAVNGFLKINNKKILISRIQLEEESANLIKDKNKIIINYNRSGLPVVEIVSDFRQTDGFTSGKEVVEFLLKLREIFVLNNLSDCDFDNGQMRVDISISLTAKNNENLGTRVEIKNLNSVESILKAVDYEISRQERLLRSGKEIYQEIRKWDDVKNETFMTREKPNTEDYRYINDPDLFAIEIDEKEINKIKKTLKF